MSSWHGPQGSQQQAYMPPHQHANAHYQYHHAPMHQQHQQQPHQHHHHHQHHQQHMPHQHQHQPEHQQHHMQQTMPQPHHHHHHHHHHPQHSHHHHHHHHHPHQPQHAHQHSHHHHHHHHQAPHHQQPPYGSQQQYYPHQQHQHQQSMGYDPQSVGFPPVPQPSQAPPQPSMLAGMLNPITGVAITKESAPTPPPQQQPPPQHPQPHQQQHHHHHHQHHHHPHQQPPHQQPPHQQPPQQPPHQQPPQQPPQQQPQQQQTPSATAPPPPEKPAAKEGVVDEKKGCGCARHKKQKDHLCIDFCPTLGCDGSCKFPGIKTPRHPPGRVPPGTKPKSRLGPVALPKGLGARPAPQASPPTEQQQQQQQPQQQQQQQPQQQQQQQQPQQQQPQQQQQSQQQPPSQQQQPPQQQPQQQQQQQQQQQPPQQPQQLQQPQPSHEDPMMGQYHSHHHQHHHHHHHHQHPPHHPHHHQHPPQHPHHHHHHQHVYMQHQPPMHTPGMGPQGMVSPMMGMQAPPPVQPKPAGTKGLHVDAPPFVAKKKSHAVDIVPPPGHPSLSSNATKGQVYTFDQISEVQNEVLQNLEELKCSIKPLINFTAEYGHFWKSDVRRVQQTNPITQFSKNLTPEEKTKRKVKGILNKLTPERYDALKQQMIEIVMELDTSKACSVEEVAHLVYDEAVTVKDFTVVYADLCYDVSRYQAEAINEAVGKSPFRRSLVNKCQLEYNEANKRKLEAEDGTESERAEKLSKMRRRALNNIHFVGELYKRHLLTEKIMHTVLDAELKSDLDDPRLEKVVQLLNTVGRSLDQTPESKEKMDKYFKSLEEMQKKKGTSRIAWLILDIMELRRNGWEMKASIGTKGPKKFSVLDEELRQEEMRKERGWVSVGSAYVPDLSLNNLQEEFNHVMISEPMKKKLLEQSNERRFELLQSLLQSCFTTEKVNPECIMRGVGHFASGAPDAVKISEVALAAAKSILNHEHKDVQAEEVAWQAFRSLLKSVGTAALGEEDVGNELFGTLMCSSQDTASLRPLLKELLSAKLLCRSPVWMALKADSDASKDLILDTEAFVGEGAEGCLSIASALLRDPQAHESNLSVCQAADDPRHVALGVLTAEWVKAGGKAGDYSAEWKTAKAEAEVEFLRKALDKKAATSQVLEEAAAFLAMAARVDASLEQQAKALCKAMIGFMEACSLCSAPYSPLVEKIVA